MNIGKSLMQFFGFEANQELKQEHIDQLDQLAAKNIELEAELTAARASAEEINATNIAQNETIAAQQATIAELEAKVAQLGALPGATPTQVDKKSDDFADDTANVKRKGYIPEQAQQMVKQFSQNNK